MTPNVKSRHILANDVSVRVVAVGGRLVAQMQCGDDWYDLDDGAGRTFVDALKALQLLDRVGIVDYVHHTRTGVFGHAARMPSGIVACYVLVGNDQESSWRQANPEQAAQILAGRQAVSALVPGDAVVAFTQDYSCGNHGWVQGRYKGRNANGHQVEVVLYPGTPVSSMTVQSLKTYDDALRDGITFLQAA